jgi:DNA-binding beta-propeller fold protein YncE
MMLRFFILLLAAMPFLGCDGGTEAADDSGSGILAGPEGIAVADGTIFVANVNSRYDPNSGLVVFDEGFIQTFDATNLAPGARLDVRCENPQYVLPADADLLVVCSGSMLPDSEGLLTPATDGALLVLDRSSLAIKQQIPVPRGTPHALSGFPGNMAWSSDLQRVYLGSGSGPYVHAVDLATETTQVFQLRDPDDRNDLVVPIWWEGRLFATSFTAGALFELDPIDGTILGEPLPITESGETEGTVDVVPGDGTLYVLHSLSQRVVAVDPTARTFAPLFTAGAAANRIRLYDGALYVLNSMDNNLTRHDLSTGTTTTPFAIFPPGSNPWKMAFVDGRMYVTAYLSDELFVVDVGSGTIEAVVE